MLEIIHPHTLALVEIQVGNAFRYDPFDGIYIVVGFTPPERKMKVYYCKQKKNEFISWSKR